MSVKKKMFFSLSCIIPLRTAGLHPDKLVLLAERHSRGTVQLANYLNTCKDTNGEHYHIELKRWKGYGL